MRIGCRCRVRSSADHSFLRFVRKTIKIHPMALWKMGKIGVPEYKG